MIAIAIGPQSSLRVSGIIASTAAAAVSMIGGRRRPADSRIAVHGGWPAALSWRIWSTRITEFCMIMRNSVILVDQIRQDIAAGQPPWTAIRESAGRRLPPIMLTAAAAVLAMIPLTRSELWGPMAMAIMGGLMIATVLTLLFVPALYAAWYRVSQPDLPVTR